VIKLKEAKAKVIISHILTMLVILFILLTIFLQYNPDLLKLIETKQLDNKKLETYALHIVGIQYSAFLFSSLIISFIRKEKDYRNAIFAVTIFLLPLSLLNAVSLLNIIMSLMSIIIAGMVSSIGTWFGYYLRPIKEEEKWS